MTILEEYCKKWCLKDVRKFTSTPTSDLYKVRFKNQNGVLKILTEVGRKNEANGIHFLKMMNCPSVVSLLEGDEGAVILDFLPGHSLYEFSKRNEEDSASAIFVKVIKDLLQCSFKEEDIQLLPPITELYKVLDREDIQQKDIGFFGHAQKLREKLKETRRKDVVLHGDLHHDNILCDSQGNFRCIDPKGFRGDPVYELGTVLKNPWGYDHISHCPRHLEKRIKLFSKELSYDEQDIWDYGYLHSALSMAWAMEDDEDTKHQEGVLKAFLSLQ